jgi:phosphoenolpyruvate carboxykinase (GTP)
VLEWIMKRCFNEADANESSIGYQPKPEDINLEGTDVSLETLQELLKVDTDLWKQEVCGIKEFYAKFGNKLPAELLHQLSVLENNLN